MTNILGGCVGLAPSSTSSFPPSSPPVYIVPDVLDAGWKSGNPSVKSSEAPYLAMDYFVGGDISEIRRGSAKKLFPPPPPLPPPPHTPIDIVDPRYATMTTLQIIDIIQICHNLGVVHRDIKPNNFVYDQAATMQHGYYAPADKALENSMNLVSKVYAGRLKIIDFGIAKSFIEHKSDNGNGNGNGNHKNAKVREAKRL